MRLHLDDRLLHGRILHGWGPRLGVKRFVLLSERLRDPLLRERYAAIAAVAGVPVLCLTPEAAAARPAEAGEFWLTDSPAAALSFCEAGGGSETLVLIGLRDPEGESLGAELRLGRENRCLLERLRQGGTKIIWQDFPAAAARELPPPGGDED